MKLLDKTPIGSPAYNEAGLLILDIRSFMYRLGRVEEDLLKFMHAS